jgi:hypothetical protein
MLNELIDLTEYYLDNKQTIDAEPRINQQRKTLIKRYSPSRWEYGKPATIQRVLSWLFAKDLFEPMNEEQYNTAVTCWLNIKNSPTLNLNLKLSVEYRPAQPTYNSKLRPFTTDTEALRKWSTLSEADCSEPELCEALNQFSEIIFDEFDINVKNYSSLAQLGEAILFKTGAFDNVFELIGSTANFVRECCKTSAPITQTRNKEPQRTPANAPIIQIDRNSSYPAVYRDFAGIPAGPPRLIYSIPASPNAYYFIKINIKDYKSKHASDDFPLLTRKGQHYVDKVCFELLLEHYELSFDFVSGLAFYETNKTISNVSSLLYNRRQNLKLDHKTAAQLMIKRLLNCLWGKSIEKGKPTYEVTVQADKLQTFKDFNNKFLWSVRKCQNSNSREAYSCRLIKPLLIKWSKPQFAAAVLSSSRATMQNLIYQAADNDIKIMMTNTDALSERRSQCIAMISSSSTV